VRNRTDPSHPGSYPVTMITPRSLPQFAAVRDALRSMLQAIVQPEDDRAFYVALATRREPVFRDAVVASPWAGRRRAAGRRHEAA
jgi:hypothetical protein